MGPFLAIVPILYPLKTLENLRFSGIFRGYKMRTLARSRLTLIETLQLNCKSVFRFELVELVQNY